MHGGYIMLTYLVGYAPLVRIEHCPEETTLRWMFTIE
jgi:hypothetical protein